MHPIWVHTSGVFFDAFVEEMRARCMVSGRKKTIKRRKKVFVFVVVFDILLVLCKVFSARRSTLWCEREVKSQRRVIGGERR